LPQNTKETPRKFSTPILGDTFLARFVVTGGGTPTSGALGDIYFDKDNDKLWVHNGTAFVSTTLS